MRRPGAIGLARKAMNRVVPPAGDDLDALLTAFFRKEMPAPWPAFRPPLARADAPPPASSNGRAHPAPPTIGPARPRPLGGPRSFWRSRLALAASLVLLLGAAWFVPGLLRPEVS